mmetsp:Transcript_34649/g.55392  ORF Transcript_34649/g.55392 Transcript_34649/m.55392 type:complete len:88 (+) Transcript_34649:3331-3594(+)
MLNPATQLFPNAPPPADRERMQRAVHQVSRSDVSYPFERMRAGTPGWGNEADGLISVRGYENSTKQALKVHANQPAMHVHADTQTIR